jgi:hypothetical protein
VQQLTVLTDWGILNHMPVIEQFYVRWLLGLNLFCDCSECSCFTAYIIISYIFKNELEKKIAQTAGKAD